MEKFYFYHAELLKGNQVLHRSYGTVGETTLKNYSSNMLTGLEEHIRAHAPFVVRHLDLNITAFNNVE